MNEKTRTRGVQGSLTAEAAFVVPIFFFAVYAFLQLFLFLQVQLEMQRYMNALVRELSGYGNLVASVHNLMASDEQETILEEYGFDALVTSVTEQAYLTYRMKDAVEDAGWITFVEDEALGFDLSGSGFYEDEGEIRLIVSYRFRIPGVLFVPISIPVVQRIEASGFYGRNWATIESQEVPDEVYIADNSTVYHRYSTCTYLKVSVRQVVSSKIDGERNQSGGIYYPCGACKSQPVGDVVYIATYGDRYHTTMICSNIRRNIQSISLAEAESRGLAGCSKCSK